MLILSRKPFQEILIKHAGEHLRIVVDELGNSAVRLGFEGPVSFEILRDDARRRSPCRPEERRAKRSKRSTGSQ